MATLYLSPAGMLIQQQNNLGQLLAGGLLNVYQAETTTPVTTYTDWTGTTANTTPIVLTAYGRLPFSIWVPTNTPHKIVLTDASSNPLYSVDNMYGINDPYVVLQGSLPGNLISQTTGTFTGTLTGFTSNPTTTCNYYIQGNTVTLTIASATATSNATTMTLTGVPSAIQPATTKMCMSMAVENISNVFNIGASLLISASSTWTFYMLGSATGFANSGTKGLPFAVTIAYDLS